MQKVSAKELQRWAGAAAVVIAASRRDAGLSQADLAEFMGWKRSVIARIEAGERPLRFAEFMAMARVLKVSPEALLARVLKW